MLLLLTSIVPYMQFSVDDLRREEVAMLTFKWVGDHYKQFMNFFLRVRAVKA